jgi:hypothetical protein
LRGRRGWRGWRRRSHTTAPTIDDLAGVPAIIFARANGQVFLAAREATIVDALSRLHAGDIALKHILQFSRGTTNLSGTPAGLAYVPTVAEEALIVTASKDTIRAAGLIGTSRREALSE